MIPAAAVEAAAKVYRDQQAELGYPKWEDLPEDGREWRRDYMRTALEAAAPHMLGRATTLADLDALPVSAIIKTEVGSVYVKDDIRVGYSTWVTINEQYYFGSADIEMPATIIYRPTP